ncbi:MAG: ATP-dependent zinc metalloprotease FtsH [Anaerovoracaceae bacterium]|nr:ATP-dependent zinc metalloprotease FtsH [Anaerovoracaceae bacterium]
MNKVTKNIGIYILIFALVMGFAYFLNFDESEKVEEYTYSQLVSSLSQEMNGKDVIKEINIVGTDVAVTLTKGNTIAKTTFSTNAEIQYLIDNYIGPLSEEGKVSFTSEPKRESLFVQMLPTIIMVVVLIFLFMFMMNQGGGNGKAMQFGRSRAKLQKSDELKKVTFKDVAGLQEEKGELEEIVDFLKNPRKYNEIGARIPKGILLVGPPGTGKTYISKACAGEAGVPFFTISGSDFVEMFVGVGASRVRDLFEQAKKNSPCIVFIDEIDAVGRKRGAGLGGGNDEREQTLNQLLVEMDGFAQNSGIIILAATNRPDVLDPALLRPGRFDRQIVIGRPDIRGREEIFAVHSRNKHLDPDVDLKMLAQRTPGFTPADIENMLNEAALLTARRNGKTIRMDEIEEAITKVMMGPEKKSRIISEKERILTAYHEAGHAVVTRSLPGTDPVHQVTIVPRGTAGGFTMYLPKEDVTFNTKSYMQNYIATCLGGRVAEQLKLDDISTGASGDIQKATEIARDMITKYGFSEKLGAVNYSDSDEVFLGKDFTSSKKYSEEVAAEIDVEIRRIINEAYDDATRILKDEDEKLERVARALLLVETIDGQQFERLYTGEASPEEIAEEMNLLKAERDAENEINRIAAEERQAEEDAGAGFEDDSEEVEADIPEGVFTYDELTGDPEEENKENEDDR